MRGLSTTPPTPTPRRAARVRRRSRRRRRRRRRRRHRRSRRRRRRARLRGRRRAEFPSPPTRAGSTRRARTLALGPGRALDAPRNARTRARRLVAPPRREPVGEGARASSASAGARRAATLRGASVSQTKREMESCMPNSGGGAPSRSPVQRDEDRVVVRRVDRPAIRRTRHAHTSTHAESMLSSARRHPRRRRARVGRRQPRAITQERELYAAVAA